MNKPKVILKVGDTVDFIKKIGKEEVEYSGIVVAVNKSDEGSKIRSLKYLTYDIKEDGCDTIHTNIEHDVVFQTILCENCGCDLLFYGIEEQVWREYRYNRITQKSDEEIYTLCDDPYICSECGESISDKNYNTLRKYLNI